MNILHSKRQVKVMILSIIALSFCIGFFLLTRIVNEKKNCSISLFSFIPQQTQLFVYAKELKTINTSAHFPKNYQQLFRTLSSCSKSSSSLILCGEKDLVLCQKISPKQESKLKEETLETIFPAFPPKIISFDNTNFYFFLTSDNSFFVCTFINGIFLGSYNFNMLKSAVDAYVSNKMFTYKPATRKHIKHFYEKEKAVFVEQNGENPAVCIQETKNGENILSGFREKQLSYSSESTSSIDYALFPDSLSAYKFEKKISFPLNPIVLTSTKDCEYQFFIASKDLGNVTLHLIPLKPEAKLIDSIQQKSASEKRIKDYAFLSFFGQYYLYYERISNSESPTLFWAQWHHFLLISENARSIIRYIRQKEKRKDKTDYSFLQKDSENNSIAQFYSENISDSDFGLFSSELLRLLNIKNKRMVLDICLEENEETFHAHFLPRKNFPQEN